MLETYISLIEQNWTLESIDEMDIIYYLEILAYKQNKNKIYIDDLL